MIRELIKRMTGSTVGKVMGGFSLYATFRYIFDISYGDYQTIIKKGRKEQEISRIILSEEEKQAIRNCYPNQQLIDYQMKHVKYMLKKKGETWLIEKQTEIIRDQVNNELFGDLSPKKKD